MKKFFKYGNKGFTLIELLVVIAILGTLSAVVALNVTQFIGSGKTEAHTAELAIIRTAVGAYMYEHSGAAVNETWVAGGTGSLTSYLMSGTNCGYSVTTAGAVTQNACTK